MKKFIITFLLVLLGGSLGFSSDLYAQDDCYGCPQFAQNDDPPPPPFEGRRGDRPFHKGMDAQDMQRWETLQLVKVLELLNLDEEKEAAFITIFRRHKKEQREYMIKRDSLIETMANVLKQDKKSNDDILKAVEDLNRLDSASFGKMKGFFDEVKSILTVEQLAKLYVFQARFGPEVFNKLKDFRRHGKNKPGNFDNDSLRNGR